MELKAPEGVKSSFMFPDRLNVPKKGVQLVVVVVVVVVAELVVIMAGVFRVAEVGL